MSNNPLLKLETTQINPLLISRIIARAGYRTITSGYYRPKNGYPNYGWNRAHPWLIKKLKAVKGWRQLFVPSYDVAEWTDARVVFLNANNETMFTIHCDSNQQAMELRDELIEEWKKLLSLYTTDSKL